MSYLWTYKKIKTKKNYNPINADWKTQVKLLSVTQSKKILCHRSYSFDQRISYQLTVHQQGTP